MIIACPACSTRYVVPDSAIGVDGRTVRCAKCRHSWHQDGPEIETPPSGKNVAATAGDNDKPAPKPGFDGTHVAPPAERSASARTAMAPEKTSPEQSSPASSAPVTPAPAPAPSDTERANARLSEPSEAEAPTQPSASADTAPAATDSHRDAAPVVHEPVTEDPVNDEIEDETPPPPTVVETDTDREPETFYYDEGSQFDYEPPFRSRRNPLKVWTAAGLMFAVLAFGTVAAVSYYGLPDWVPVSRPTFAMEQTDLVLDFPADQQDRRALPNGSEFFGASGTVTNTGRETRRVPSILIVMRDARDRIVYSWEVVPPQSTLAPGESMTINEAVTDIPKAAKFAEIGWKPS
ncbi:thioredoxin [Altererythrobacter luteolus]|uniref:Thioredoxin n=1 Tax=Pontixanthobacter luteolus TaxID=295089 RepID=A0A6I4V367_9SPHN|nr:zinc-ribbon domain-containing protein [Pontixanthobacter luteolus]MXP48353.1 thioredoxin [Pontixanthobacter luteolus]